MKTSADMAAVPDMSGGGCQPAPGRSFFVNDWEVMPPGQGFDLDGDGIIDNNYGQIAGFYNPYLQGDVVNGQTIILINFTQLPGPPLTDGSPVTFSLFNGVDAHDPPTPAANLNGGGQFRVALGQFDVQCHPTSEVDGLNVQNGVIAGTRDHFVIVVPDFGSVSFDWVHFSATFNADYSLFDVRFGAVLSACALSTQPIASTSNPNQSELDTLVSLGMQPDIDYDHDGLAMLALDGQGHVSQCTTASGVVINGSTCPCDPRVHDGYSGGYRFVGVPATIVGTVGQ